MEAWRSDMQRDRGVQACVFTWVKLEMESSTRRLLSILGRIGDDSLLSILSLPSGLLVGGRT